MTVFAIETSCDETSVAVVRDQRVLANVVSSQVALHREYGGVVPELAARAHLANLPVVAGEALKKADVSIRETDVVAATRGPGLPPALMVGFFAARGLASRLGRPFYGIHHHEAHLYSPWIRDQTHDAAVLAVEPCVSLVVSGGHTLLIHLKREFSHRVLGATLDDAAGECFDKTAKMIGLRYPGGPEIDRLGSEGDPAAFSFPRPMVNAPSLNFSFSGLKTAVRYFVRDHPAVARDAQGIRDLCASVQAAIVEVLVKKTIRAAKETRERCITVSGGVASNTMLRREMSAAATTVGRTIRFAQPCFCGDNAAMIALLAERYANRGRPSLDPNADILPSWPL